jgi:hypothetical protein
VLFLPPLASRARSGLNRLASGERPVLRTSSRLCPGSGALELPTGPASPPCERDPPDTGPISRTR